MPKSKIGRYLGKTAYSLKIRRLFGDSIIAYWPLWEPSNSVDYDISGNGRNGAYTGVDLGYPGIGDGHTCPYFDGATDYVNVYSASLAAAFNGAEGTIIIWEKVYNAEVWADGLYHYFVHFYVNNNNRVCFYKSTDNYQYCTYYVGGVSKVFQIVGGTPTTFNCLGMTWSASNDRARAFYNGLQNGSSGTGLGTWAGVPTLTVVGAYNTTPLYPWYGYLGDGIFLNREATPAEMLKAAQI